MGMGTEVMEVMHGDGGGAWRWRRCMGMEGMHGDGGDAWHRAGGWRVNAWAWRVDAWAWRVNGHGRWG